MPIVDVDGIGHRLWELLNRNLLRDQESVVLEHMRPVFH